MGVIRATPVASFIIVAFFVLSRGNVPGFMSFLMVLPVVFANVLKGLEQTDGKLMEMAKLFRVPRVKAWWAIRVPAALPYAVTAAATTLGMAWKAGIAAEVIGNAGLSIGGALRDSRSSLDSPALFAWTLVVILLSMTLEMLLGAALKRASARLGAAGITN
jgi:NitT/TauT family transport system permease protein